MDAVEVGQVVHLSDVKLPEGVESVALSHGSEHDLAIANVSITKGGSDEEEAASAEDGADGAEGEANNEESKD
jgi:large subunit ribosomal protein L25